MSCNMEYVLHITLWFLSYKVFEVTDELNEIKLSCFNGTSSLPYRDNNTGEYQCGVNGTKIYVKFRSKFCSKTACLCVFTCTFILVLLASARFYHIFF